MFHSGEWLLAANSHKKGLNDEAALSSLGRHESTDEVFVLLKGQAVLVLAGKGSEFGPIQAVKLQPDTAYTVEKGEWHAILFEENSSCLIVENAFSKAGENYTRPLTPAQIKQAQAAISIL